MKALDGQFGDRGHGYATAAPLHATALEGIGRAHARLGGASHFSAHAFPGSLQTSLGAICLSLRCVHVGYRLITLGTDLLPNTQQQTASEHVVAF